MVIKMIKIAPSILASDFSNLNTEINQVVKGGADLIHLDIMDGVFVPNITFGPEVIKCLPKFEGIEYDAHLMIAQPENNIQSFLDLNLDRIAIHVESTIHIHRLLRVIRDHGTKPAVCLNPSTSLTTIEWILEEVDMVVIMTVNPGFGGQSFIESGLRKIEALKEMIIKQSLNVEIEVDGGVNAATVSRLTNAGMDIAVAGSAIFKSNDYAKAILALKQPE
jgi:ribulose-phosphate 3-epimerase